VNEVVANDRDAKNEGWNARICDKGIRGVGRTKQSQSCWWSRKKGGIQLLGPTQMDLWGYMICSQLLYLVDLEARINGWILQVLVLA
jgi:hypothetical protein